MARKEIGSIFDRNNRNNMNDNFEYLFEGSKRIDALYNRAENVLAEAKKTNDMNEDVQRQLNNLIVESGNANAEVSQARASYDVLNTRLNTLDNKISNLDEYASNPVLQTKQEMPLVTFVDDDGYPQVYDMLKPIAEEFKVPIVSAVITSRVFNQEQYAGISMTFAQLKECQNAGMEIQSHSVNHKRTGELPIDEQEFEIAESKRWMSKYGFNTEAFIYPFGSNTPETEKLVRKYYKAGIHTSGGVGQINYQPIPKQARMYRIYYNELNPATETEKNKVEYCKAQIDEAIANNGWVIIGSHCFYDGFDPALYREVVEYAVNSSAKVVGLKEGLDIYGNIIDLPDFQVGANGKLTSSQVSKYVRINTTVTANDTLDKFESDKTSYRTFTKNNAITFKMPEQNEGILFVHHLGFEGYAYQEYISYTTNNVYQRYWNRDTESWSDWTKNITSDDVKFNQTVIVYHADQPISDYPSNQTTYRGYNATQALDNDMPEGRSGLLITHNLYGDEYAHQFYYVRGFSRIWKRAWNGSGNSWREWERVGLLSYKIEQTVKFATVPVGTSDFTMSSSVFTVDRNIVVNPKSPLPAGITLTWFVSQAGALTIRVFNSNDVNTTMGDIVMSVRTFE